MNKRFFHLSSKWTYRQFLVALGIALLSTLSSFGFSSPHLVRLTVINKADIEVALSLTATKNGEDIFYYFFIPKGDEEAPTEKTFTIEPAVYSVTATYLEAYDPVYGYPRCGGNSPSGRYGLVVHGRLIIPPCRKSFSAPGDMGMWKLGAPSGGRRFRYLP
ncbi:MAG: hypothetical protein DDG59_08855 [Anaerolineae bacterium]|nr:MAG: hypothetical protein DDG59_08855 [Anaerolineae bacterium]